MADEQPDDIDILEAAPEVADTAAAPPQYGVGPFSIREVALGGVWLVAFIVSFLSLNPIRFDSVWTSGLTWILTIGVPTVAVFLIVLRRLSPDGIRRVGSLGVDQFASVAFSVSAVFWLVYVWETVAIVAGGGPWVRSWVLWVEFVLMLAGVVLTVFAPFIPVLCEDFRERPEVVAHRNARPLRPIAARPPRAPKPVVAAPLDAQPDYAPPAYEASAGPTAEYSSPYSAEPVADASWAPTSEQAVAHEPAAPEPETARHQAFWALVPEEREVVDESGAPIFTIGPTAWALVIEDRGDVFVMRHEDGRIGYLHDVTEVTRG